MKTNHFLINKLPTALEPLMELALDLRWTWSHAGDSLWKTIDPQVWEQTKNPYVILQNLTKKRLKELEKDIAFRAQLERLIKGRDGYCRTQGWYGETDAGKIIKGIAYFSMEFGLSEALPLYAGGLGILAGDYLKAASDLAVPVTGIGLFYQEGYFRQVLDLNGWQEEVYPYNDPMSLPVQPVRDGSGAWLKVEVGLPGRTLLLRVWKVKVGRVTLYLMDSNDSLNSPSDRGITGKLYGGGKEMRLKQEIVLGIGGWRLIEALGLTIDLCHLNEGHAAFVTLERARFFMEKNDLDFRKALWATRAGNLFTTHTPVAAGFDAFPQELLLKYGREYTKTLGITPHELGALGRKDRNNQNEPFNMAYLAMRTCGQVNGVSKLHGEVSRRIFQPLYPDWPEREVPVIHITNGIHVPTWDSPWADDAWTKACGKERWRVDPQRLTQTILEKMSDEDLWRFRGEERADLVNYARKRLTRQSGQGGENENSARKAKKVLDPNVLTLGFARRFAEYKRPNLLLSDIPRLIRVLTNPERPVQLLVAGKAHPQDEAGKRFVQEWTNFVKQPEVRAHALFLEDYDMILAQEMVQGVDVWINTPRRPWEACGTSGMKVLVNGGLNLSELDGWWAEAYSEDVGWALGDGEDHQDDGVEARQIYHLLEEEIIPAFYNRDETGVPRAWVARIRASMSKLAPRFSANRMIQEYVEKMYLPAFKVLTKRIAGGRELAGKLERMEIELKERWHELHWGNLTVKKNPEGFIFDVHLYHGEILPDYIQVQLYADPVGSEEAIRQVMKLKTTICGCKNGYVYSCRIKTKRPVTDFTPRVVPFHPAVFIPAEMNLINWRKDDKAFT